MITQALQCIQTLYQCRSRTGDSFVPPWWVVVRTLRGMADTKNRKKTEKKLGCRSLRGISWVVQCFLSLQQCTQGRETWPEPAGADIIWPGLQGPTAGSMYAHLLYMPESASSYITSSFLFVLLAGLTPVLALLLFYRNYDL